MLELPPLSLYVHIPWCVRKCPYCDFNSHEAKSTVPENDYVTALCNDFDHEMERSEARPLQSIFIGGGPPSLFSAAAYERLLNHIQKRSLLAADIEITLEANPGTAEAIKFRDFRATGINRLSLGIQSFSDPQLRKLGRIHDGNQARMSIEIARQSGGSAVVEFCPLSLKKKIDVWGDQPGGMEIMHRIKQKFDPLGIMNPGRFVGKI